MTTLLYLQASPRGTDSQSIALADAYLSSLRANNPDLHVDTMPLRNEHLPAFDQAKASAKMAVISGRDFDDVQHAAWDEVVAFAQRFVTADRYLIAAPMWNAGIRYRLKHCVDIVHQPGVTWTLNPACDDGHGCHTAQHGTKPIVDHSISSCGRGPHAGMSAVPLGSSDHAAVTTSRYSRSSVMRPSTVQSSGVELLVGPAGGRGGVDFVLGQHVVGGVEEDFEVMKAKLGNEFEQLDGEGLDRATTSHRGGHADRGQESRARRRRRTTPRPARGRGR
jgi:FMN-dependent NADH-azoreductase